MLRPRREATSALAILIVEDEAFLPSTSAINADFACVEALVVRQEVVCRELGQGAAQAVAGDVDVAGFQ